MLFHGGEPWSWVRRCCCCAFAAPAPVTLCCMIPKCSSSQFSTFLFLFGFARDAAFTCAPFSFCDGRWASQGCANKNVHFIRQHNVSFRTYWYLQRISVSFSRLTVSFKRMIATVRAGKCRSFVRFARGGEINRSVKINVRPISAPQQSMTFVAADIRSVKIGDFPRKRKSAP